MLQDGTDSLLPGSWSHDPGYQSITLEVDRRELEDVDILLVFRVTKGELEVSNDTSSSDLEPVDRSAEWSGRYGPEAGVVSQALHFSVDPVDDRLILDWVFDLGHVINDRALSRLGQSCCVTHRRIRLRDGSVRRRSLARLL